jgi:hypothetical protein
MPPQQLGFGPRSIRGIERKNNLLKRTNELVKLLWAILRTSIRQSDVEYLSH